MNTTKVQSLERLAADSMVKVFKALEVSQTYMDRLATEGDRGRLLKQSFDDALYLLQSIQSDLVREIS